MNHLGFDHFWQSPHFIFTLCFLFLSNISVITLISDHVYCLPAAATLRVVVRHWRCACAGEDADTCGEKGVREVGRLSGTVCGAGWFRHECRELPPANKGRPALPYPGSPSELSNFRMEDVSWICSVPVSPVWLTLGFIFPDKSTSGHHVT